MRAPGAGPSEPAHGRASRGRNPTHAVREVTECGRIGQAGKLVRATAVAVGRMGEANEVLPRAVWASTCISVLM